MRKEIRKIETGSDLASHLGSGVYRDFDPADLDAHHVDGHRLVFDEQGVVTARCSLWWSQVPLYQGVVLGVIGHFAALERESALLLLNSVSEELASRGCSLLIGPMDGNTWRSYRLVTETGTEPPFFMEPVNPPQYPNYFVGAGFSELASYRSALCDNLEVIDSRIPAAIQRLRAAGLKWRPLDVTRFEDELKAIYQMSCESFIANFLYTPIGEDDFITQYRGVRAVIVPELVLMAEREGELVGYLFAVPDLLQAREGGKIDTVIIKTVAVRPGRKQAGLGSVLVAEVQRIALEMGYSRAIHALMYEGNKSGNISDHYARTMRRYTLYQKRLATCP